MFKKSCCIFMIILILLSGLSSLAYGEDVPVNFVVNGKHVNFANTPIIRDGVTYVDLQSLANALSLSYKTYPGHDSAVVSSYSKSICFVPNDEHATVSDLTGNSDSEYYYRILSAPCIYVNNRITVAARDMADVFGYSLTFNSETNTVYFGFSPEMLSDRTRQSIYSKAYYFQNQEEFNLPSYGSGYCWACSYAMLLSNVTGIRITPSDIAAINLSKNSSGAYCYHSDIVKAYNLKFVNALPTDSPYYGGRDAVSGGTFIKNPSKDRNVTIAALKEALTLHPEGVMVRYASFPHTIVAVGFEGDVILFNDPAPTSSAAYGTEGRYQCVPFEQTCIPSRSIPFEEITFIQAISY